MLIVSKFHDYYDGALSGGVDKTIVYERHEYDAEIEADISEDFYPLVPLNDYFESIIIGFCGKMYYGLRPTRRRISVPDYDNTWDEFSKTVYWSADDLISHAVFQKQFGESLDQCTNKYSRWVDFRDSRTTRQRIIHFFDGQASDKYNNIFMDNKLVCFQFKPKQPPYTYFRQVHHNMPKRSLTLGINPQLTSFNFVKVIDPYTALQEIMMYISGVLGSPNRPMVAISDEVRLDKHGFDRKGSFRKGPTKAEKHEKRKKNIKGDNA